MVASLLIVAGAVCLFLGWWGVSGHNDTAKQLPYLVSGGLTGVVLIVVGAMFLATPDVSRQASRLRDVQTKVDDLYALLVETTDAPAVTARSDDVVAVPAGTSYHRPSCRLASGKPDVTPVDADQIRDRQLQPCPVCSPDPVPTAD